MITCLLMTVGFVFGVVLISAGLDVFTSEPVNGLIFLIGGGFLAVACVAGPIGIVVGIISAIFSGSFAAFKSFSLKSVFKGKGNKGSNSGNKDSGKTTKNNDPPDDGLIRTRADIDNALLGVDKSRSVRNGSIWVDSISVKTNSYGNPAEVDVTFRYRYYEGADSSTTQDLANGLNSIMSEIQSALSNSAIPIKITPLDGGEG